jgi:hypothetical protein
MPRSEAVATMSPVEDAYDAAAREHRRRAYVLASYKNKPDSAEKTAARRAHEDAAARWALLHFARLATKDAA